MAVKVDWYDVPECMAMSSADDVFVSEGCECPRCGEARLDHVVCVEDNRALCTLCNTFFDLKPYEHSYR